MEPNRVRMADGVRKTYNDNKKKFTRKLCFEVCSWLWLWTFWIFWIFKYFKCLNVLRSSSKFPVYLKNTFLPWKVVKHYNFGSFLGKKRWKWLFRPVFGVRSTQMLVKIYNNIECMLRFFGLSFCLLPIKTVYPCTTTCHSHIMLSKLLKIFRRKNDKIKIVRPKIKLFNKYFLQVWNHKCCWNTSTNQKGRGNYSFISLHLW